MMKSIVPEKDQIVYAAFLRGINVGGNKLIKMEDLRKAFEFYGYRDVKTVLASGNVLFSAPEENTTALSRNIASKLKETFQHDILVIVRSIDELRELDARQPFKDVEITPQTKLFVTFISENKKHREILSLSRHDGFQILQISDDTICSVLDYQPGIDAVLLMSTIEKEFGKNVTTRSWNTITRLLKIYGKN
jgi:uncharacterized protein (DUF1697 family)